MLAELFLQVLNMSFTASFVILFVLAARLLLKKAPKVFSYALWSVALFRLVCPFSFESAVSLLPNNTPFIPSELLYPQAAGTNTGLAGLDNMAGAALPPALAEAGAPSLQTWFSIGAAVWLLGIAALLVYSVASLLMLQKRLKDAVPQGGNIYIAKELSTPFVMGVIRPKIYLPAALSGEEKRYILLHEETHVRRLDPLAKILSFLVLCVHWFNPLVWMAFFLSGRDMEMSCDEAVIRRLGSGVKQSYSSSLLTLATGRRTVGGTPLAFGEGDTKGRIKNVLDYKTPKFWGMVTILLAVAAMAIGLLGNPMKPNAYVSRYPGEYNTQLSDYSGIQIKDNDGNDISHIAIDLWYAANEIYNVDDMKMFEIGEYEATLREYIVQSNELLNYYAVVESVFTQNGIAQLEQTQIGGPDPLIRKQDDKVYRMGAWKTGYSFGNALADMRVKELAGNRITLAATYAIVDFDNNILDHVTVDFTIAKVGGIWLVDDYVYPETYGG